MTDRILFELDIHHALGADSMQWIVYRRAGKGARAQWKAIAFVGSTRAVLERVLREKGIQVTPEAQQRLSGLPERFAAPTR